jgi:hypothetical protein
VDTIPDPLLLRKSGSTWNRTRTSGSAIAAGMEDEMGHEDRPVYIILGMHPLMTCEPVDVSLRNMIPVCASFQLTVPIFNVSTNNSEHYKHCGRAKFWGGDDANAAYHEICIDRHFRNVQCCYDVLCCQIEVIQNCPMYVAGYVFLSP